MIKVTVTSRTIAASALASAVFWLSACSASTEADQPGTCSLRCSNPRVASSDVVLVPLLPEGTDAVTVQCTADFATAKLTAVPLNGPMQVKFIAYEKGQPFGGGNAGRTDEGLGEGKEPYLINKRPVGGIGFEPWLYGGLAAEKTNAEHLLPDGKTIQPFKYAGIVTPKSEWCSDSCGVIAYEFWPLCIEGKENAITAGVAAGGAVADRFVNVTVANSVD